MIPAITKIQGQRRSGYPARQQVLAYGFGLEVSRGGLCRALARMAGRAEATDASDLRRQLGAYVSTPNGNGGSFWQSGRGPAADKDGNIYAVTGNGDYDGIHNFGESFVKLSSQANPRWALQLGRLVGPLERYGSVPCRDHKRRK